MAHFAKLDEDNNVISVHVVNNNELLDTNGVEREELGVAFLIGLHKHPYWKQTSYNGTFRKRYAGIGYTYNRDLDAFVPPRPYPSWVFNDAQCDWQAPIPQLNSDTMWDENLNSWIPITSE
jgi:hypothetical protein